MRSIGEKRVRTNFNVSGSSDIDFIKDNTADLINFLENLKEDAGKEKLRLINLAQTVFEDAAMWAVKSVT